jgi:hypothetical protein
VKRALDFADSLSEIEPLKKKVCAEKFSSPEKDCESDY